MKKVVPLLHAALVAAVLPLVHAAPASAAPDDVTRLADVFPVAEEAVSFQGRTYFPGYTAAHGTELWVSDGTPTGTREVLDLAPLGAHGDPEDLAAFRGRLYFSAVTPALGRELWSTDGTAAGTRLELDINPGSASSQAGWFTVSGDRMYFAATDGVHGVEPWSTDGTAAGTRMVNEIIPGPGSSFPAYFAPLGDRVVYRAYTTSRATKPFVSGPGVPAGVRQLDPLAFDVDLGVGDIEVVGDRVFFRAGDATTGGELWVSGGQPGDARLLAEFFPGAVGGNPTWLTASGDRVFFTTRTPALGEELWSSDGTKNGTVLVRDIWGQGRSSSPQDLTLLGDQLVFSADDGVHGRELWATGGTSESTHLIADGYAGPADGVPLGLSTGTPVAGQLLYRGADSQGVEPWMTDGRTLRRVADIAPGVDSSQPSHAGVAGNAVLFSASDGQVQRLYGWTAVGSTTAVRAKRKYSAGQARRKRITLPVTVRSTAGTTPSGGRVTLTLKGRVIGSANLVDGAARVRIVVRLKPGKTHRIVAHWSGVPALASGSMSSPAKVRIKVRR